MFEVVGGLVKLTDGAGSRSGAFDCCALSPSGAGGGGRDPGFRREPEAAKLSGGAIRLLGDWGVEGLGRGKRACASSCWHT